MLVKCPNLWQALHCVFFLLDTGIPLCELHLHIWNICPYCYVHSWSQTSSCVGLAPDNSHCPVACGLIALISQVVFSSYICLLATLYTGV